MRTFLIVAASTLAAAITSASAQTSPAQSGPQNPAVKASIVNNSDAPVAGANSFTRGQATSRIEARGYGAVENLRKDHTGVWRGMAKKDGQLLHVSVDYQGNVIAN
jgi:hypothetical protein